MIGEIIIEEVDFDENYPRCTCGNKQHCGHSIVYFIVDENNMLTAESAECTECQCEVCKSQQ